CCRLCRHWIAWSPGSSGARSPSDLPPPSESSAMHDSTFSAPISGYSITPAPLEPPIMFVDHQPLGRSGHLGHAMFQRPDGALFAFFPNCSSDDPGRHGTSGHSAAGWMEYKRSDDAGMS